jgi:hypothetical protein
LAEPQSLRNISFGARGKARLREAAAALLVILIFLIAIWPTKKIQPYEVFDQPFYMGIAHDLLAEGKFTNGFAFQTTSLNEPRPSGMRFTPLYPSLVAAAALVDPTFHKGMECLVNTRGKDATCSRNASVIRSIQLALLAGTYWLIWFMAGAISNKRRVAWTGLVIALLTAPELMGYVDYVMTEITALFLVTATTAAAVQGILSKGRKGLWFGISGALFGLTGLTRPAFFDLFLMCAVVGLACCLRRVNRRYWTSWLSFSLAGLIVVAPWIIRNISEFHVASLTLGYGAHVLNERIAFDEMTPFEYRLSYLCWLPDGNGLGSYFFGRGACHRFQWSDYPDSFYSIGNGPLMQQSLAASGGWPQMFHYLMTTYILPHPIKHSLVTISLALRGAYISRYWGLILLPVSLWQTWIAFRGKDFTFLAVSLPAWVMLAFAAAISVNQPRYNLMLIAPFSIAGAVLIEALLVKWRCTQPVRHAG